MAAKAKLLECHDQETEESFHHRENPTRRFTFGPHGTPAAAGAARAAEDWQFGNASAEAAMTAAGGVAEDGPGAPLAITHGPAAEVLYEGTEYDVDMGNAAEASEATAAAAAGVRPTLPQEEWDKMPRSQQRKSWMMRGVRLRCAPV